MPEKWSIRFELTICLFCCHIEPGYAICAHEKSTIDYFVSGFGVTTNLDNSLPILRSSRHGLFQAFTELVHLCEVQRPKVHVEGAVLIGWIIVNIDQNVPSHFLWHVVIRLPIEQIFYDLHLVADRLFGTLKELAWPAK